MPRFPGFRRWLTDYPCFRDFDSGYLLICDQVLPLLDRLAMNAWDTGV
jgi:hypothetical protein